MIHFAFGSNILFSLLCSYFALLETNMVNARYFQTNPLLLQVIGVSLLLFALFILYHLLKGATILRSLLIIVQDFLWILSTSLFLVFYNKEIGNSGANLMININLEIFVIMSLQIVAVYLQQKSKTKHGIVSKRIQEVGLWFPSLR